MKFFYEKFWVPVFGYILSKFVFLIEGKEQNYKLKPYTVHYRDFQNIRLENCFYAFDAYEARTLAMEFNKYINEHPNSIDLIRCEK